MTVPRQIFDFLIEPFREADKREGKDFLERYLRGPQSVWETTDQKIKDIPKLWSVADCPDEYLQYLKWIVGWTSQLDHITDELTFDELRRLISISGRLWKLRGSEDTIIDVMRFATGARCRYWNWFDFRWVSGETYLEEEHQGRDAWIIDADDEYESNLRIVDDGTLNKTLVINLLKLMRATGERWEITYLAFLDQFILDGDDTQWVTSVGDSPSLVVAGGTMSLTDTSQIEKTWPFVGLGWSLYSAYFRLRGTSSVGSVGYGFYFNYLNAANHWYVRACPADRRIELWQVVSSTPSLKANRDMSDQPFYDNVWYGYRVSITPDISAGTVWIQIFIDGMEFVKIQKSPPAGYGRIGIFHDSGETLECSEIEVMDLPIESDYVDINS